MSELTNTLEEYWQKWEIIRMENKKVLMDANMALRNTNPGLGASNGARTSSSDFICFNPAPDTHPGFLECESSMLDMLNWMEQATYWNLWGGVRVSGVAGHSQY